MATKSGGKIIFAKSRQLTLQITWGSKILSKLFYLTPFPVFAFNAEIQDVQQMWKENNFCEKAPVDSAPCRSKISLRFQEERVFAFYTEFKMAAKSGRKTIYRKGTSLVCISPVD